MENKQSTDGYEISFKEFIASNLSFENGEKLEKITREIIQHKSQLEKNLKREVGIEISMLDYIKNINHDVHIPDILDSPQIRKIKRGIYNGNHGIKFYDTSELSLDINKEIERAHRYGSHFSFLMFDLHKEKTGNKDSLSFQEITSLNNIFRMTDNLYTYDDNRFVLLLAESEVGQSINTANKIRSWAGNRNIIVHISIVPYGMFNIDTDRKMLSAADSTIRKAYESGNGAVCLYKGTEIQEIHHANREVAKEIQKHERLECMGFPIHSGKALGNIFIYNDLLSHELETYDVSEENLDLELQRILKAIDRVDKDLALIEGQVKEDLNREYSAIFEAHRLILKDQQLSEEIKKNLYEKKINGEAIVRDVFRRWENRFLAFEDEIFRNKSQDIVDISKRIIMELQGLDSHILEDIPENSIIFANRMLPSDTVNLKKSNIKALVLKEGSRFSHMAILSRAMNIPLIIVDDLELSTFSNNEKALVDGDGGRVVINPGEEELKTELEKDVKDQSTDFDPKVKDLSNLQYRGEPIQLYAAASSLEESLWTMQSGAEGIGLFRIEVFYLSQNSLPDVETLVRGIDKILKPCKTKEIVIRLLDIGGDKNLSYLNITERYNSSLGLRGVRLYRKFPHLLDTQLRAILKLSRHYNIKIMVPMITLTDDMIFVRETFKSIKKKMKIKKDIPVGAMIETPAAVLEIQSILEHSDFISIGSNDLIQYTMAADREKLSVTRYYEEGGQIVQSFIKRINDESGKCGVPSFLCGELAQDFKLTKELLESGCRNFTVPPSFLSSLHEQIEKITSELSFT